jgi:aspartate racemase
MLGVIGGMGPLATADFFRKLIDETSAARDEDHVPVLIHSVPQLPRRPPAILADGESPLPALRQARDRLLAGGATALAMPCNTAHYWYDELALECPVPFLHIVDAVAADLGAYARRGTRVGLIATQATLAGRVYDARLGALGCELLVPLPDDMEAHVLPAIVQVKRGALAEAGRTLEPAISKLFDGGADAVVLACTETPIALDAIGSPLRGRCIDSTRALARACVRWWHSTAGGEVQRVA